MLISLAHTKRKNFFNCQLILNIFLLPNLKFFLGQREILEKNILKEKKTTQWELLTAIIKHLTLNLHHAKKKNKKASSGS